MVTIIQQNQILSLIVRDRNGIIFEGPIYSLTSFNERGEFDVLPLHANFISLIREKIIAHLPDGVSKQILFQFGVLMVKENVAEVYIGILH